MQKALQTKVLGMPLPAYLIVLALTCACMACGVIPKSLVPAFLVLMVLGEGLNMLGKSIPVVKTYLGGSVVCIMGAAVLRAVGLIPAATLETLDYFVNDSGFLIFYIAALITGSLFNVDRNLLLRATVKLLPVAVVSLAVGELTAGLMGLVMGYGFLDGVLFLGVPMTSGGMTAGTVPLSGIYAQALGITAADALNRMAPATVLGNIIAIVYGGLLNRFGKTHPKLTGNGNLVNDGRPVEKLPPVTPTVTNMAAGLVLALAFYQLGALLHHFVSVVPTYGWMIIAVVAVKCSGKMPRELEDSARAWGQFAIAGWTPAALAGIGFTLIDLNTILQSMTVLYLFACIAIVTTVMLTATVLGSLAGFYPLESAIAAGLTVTNMGGSGNVAILSSSERMELLPFAQIVTRCCGALMLTVGGILVNLAR